MKHIPDHEVENIKKIFENLEGEVKILNFTQEFECQFCKETREILEEVTHLSEKISFKIHDFVKEKELAKKYGVDKIPAILILGKKDFGIRYFGIPSGYEFASLIEDIVDVSKGKTDLSQDAKEKLKKINKEIHIQVFVTPTCPYCPLAVRLSHKIAIENEFVRADMIESAEFPHLANKYRVFSVPKTIINEKVEIEGAVPERIFVEKVLEALK